MTLSLSDRLCNMANEPTTSFSAAALMQEAYYRIDRLTRELGEAKAALAGFYDLRKLIGKPEGENIEIVRALDKLTAKPNPGQAMLDEMRLMLGIIEAMAMGRIHITPFEGAFLCGDAFSQGYPTPLDAGRAALASMKGETKP